MMQARQTRRRQQRVPLVRRREKGLLQSQTRVQAWRGQVRRQQQEWLPGTLMSELATYVEEKQYLLHHHYQEVGLLDVIGANFLVILKDFA